MRFQFVVAGLAAGLLVACSKGGDAPSVDAKAAPAPPAVALLLAPEDLRVVGGSGDRAGGPVIIGAIQPERRADLRAEISAMVLQVFKENGEAVKTGDLLVRLDDTSIRDGLLSADESARAASQAFEQAERQVQRLKTLQAQGMSSMQALEDAEMRRNSAQSELAAAKTRVVTARQQLRRTEVRAPFDGVVSERKVSGGDTAQIGKELVKVIDPRSMRFEGLVSADRMGELQLEQDVSFRINGFPQAVFSGKIKRIDASANATTRQVAVLVAFTGGNAPQMAGLYAEGRAALLGPASLMLPAASLLRKGDAAYVWRVKDNTLSKVAVQLGERDVRTGEYVLRGGLAQGELILRNPSGTLVDGQKVEFAGASAAQGG
jgi:RND family efflux transporter MFP subunit